MSKLKLKILPDGKRNFVDERGNFISRLSFQWAQAFQEGFAVVQISNDKWNYIDERGNFLLNAHCDACAPFSQGFAWALSGGLWHLIDRSGSFIAAFLKGFGFSCGRALVQLESGKWNFIDENLAFLSKTNFVDAMSFSENFASVKIDDNHWNYIDVNGRFILNFPVVAAFPFVSGFGLVQLPNKRWNFVDSNGAFLSSESFSFATSFSKDDVAEVFFDDGSYRYLDIAGRLHFDEKTAILASKTYREVSDILN